MTLANPSIQVIQYLDYGQPEFGMVVLLKISGKWQVRFGKYLAGQTTDESINYVADNGEAFQFEKARTYFTDQYTMMRSDYLQPNLNA